MAAGADMLEQAGQSTAAYERLISRAFFPIKVSGTDRDAPLVARFASRGVGCFKKTQARVLHASPIFGRRSWKDIDQRADDAFLLVAPASGEVVFHQFGRSANVDSNHMVLIDQRVPYEFERRCGGTVVSHHIPGGLLHRVSTRPESLCVIEIDAKQGVGSIVRALFTSGWRHMDSLKDVERHLLLDNIVGLIAAACGDERRRGTRRPVRSPPLFIKAIGCIEECLVDPELDAHKVAESINSSVSHLYATMKKHGTTVGATIVNLRLDRCAKDLVSPLFHETRITDVAFSWGFSDAAHFSRCFRARFGCSPSQFRAAAQAVPNEGRGSPN